MTNAGAPFFRWRISRFVDAFMGDAALVKLLMTHGASPRQANADGTLTLGLTLRSKPIGLPARLRV